MLEVKIFSSDRQRELEEQLNQFFNDVKDEKVNDVKFSSSIAVSADGKLYEMFSAMVIFQKSNVE